MHSVEDEEDLLLYTLHSEASKKGKNLLLLRACEVINFSSQYGSEESLSYSAENLIGRPTIYPNSGDHAYSFQLVKQNHVVCFSFMCFLFNTIFYMSVTLVNPIFIFIKVCLCKQAF